MFLEGVQFLIDFYSRRLWLKITSKSLAESYQSDLFLSRADDKLVLRRITYIVGIMNKVRRVNETQPPNSGAEILFATLEPTQVLIIIGITPKIFNPTTIIKCLIRDDLFCK